MNLLKKAYYTACSILPPEIVKRISPVKTLLPYHHLVSDKELLHIKHLYSYKNVKQFKTDIDFLLKYFHPVSVADISQSVNNDKDLPSNSFLLTFDDGFREVYEIIAPILLEKGIPAVFFVNPAFIGNKELFYRCKISLVIEELSRRDNFLKIGSDIFQKEYKDFSELRSDLKKINQLNLGLLDRFAEELNYSFDNYLKEHQPFLTLQQVIELNRQGFIIGSHSWDHPYYEFLTTEEQIRQTVSSVRYIKEKVQGTYSCFSFPHTDLVISQQFMDRLKKEEDKIDLLFGIQNQKLEFQNKVLHRFNAERPDVNIKSQVNGILLYCLMQKVLGRYKIKRL